MQHSIIVFQRVLLSLGEIYMVTSAIIIFEVNLLMDSFLSAHSFI